jgi:hypothetical protein
LNELGAGAVVTKRATKSSGNSAAAVSKGKTTDGSATQFHAVKQISPVAYQIGPGTPGWVAVDAPFEEGWSLNGQSATATAEGTVLVRVGAQGGVLRFTPWALVRLGYLISAGVFAAFAAFLAIDRRRRTARAP